MPLRDSPPPRRARYFRYAHPAWDASAFASWVARSIEVSQTTDPFVAVGSPSTRARRRSPSCRWAPRRRMRLHLYCRISGLDHHPCARSVHRSPFVGGATEALRLPPSRRRNPSTACPLYDGRRMDERWFDVAGDGGVRLPRPPDRGRSRWRAPALYSSTTVWPPLAADRDLMASRTRPAVPRRHLRRARPRPVGEACGTATGSTTSPPTRRR